MALIICYIIACIQIVGAAFNLWGFNPRLLLNFSLDKNTLFIALFVLMQLLGLVGAALVFAKMRLGFLLSMAHHILLLPGVLIASSRFLLLTDDRLNASLFYISKPSGTSVAFYWSAGWTTVFEQVTKGVPRGSVFVGINLFALACAVVFWVTLRQMAAERAQQEREMQMRRRQQARRRQREQAPQPRAPQPAYEYSRDDQEQVEYSQLEDSRHDYQRDEYPQQEAPQYGYRQDGYAQREAPRHDYQQREHPQHDYRQNEDRHQDYRQERPQREYSQHSQQQRAQPPQPRPQRIGQQPGVRLPPRIPPRES